MGNFEISLNDKIKSIDKHNYNEILYLCSLGSYAIYQDHPLEELNNGKFSASRHSIDKMCVTQAIQSDINGLNELKYMIYSSSKLKNTLFISIRGTKNMQDFLTDINCISQEDDLNPGKFHSGIYNRSNLVDISYFINKLKEGYRLYFTGHSLGAAVASMLAIKIISRIDEKYRSKVFSIGFGSPLFADQNFAKKFKYSNNFHFIENQNDIVVSLLKDLSDFFHNQDNEKNTNMLDSFSKLLNVLSEFVLNDKAEASLLSSVMAKFFKSNDSTKGFSTLVEHIVNNLSPVIKVVGYFIPQYCSFGNTHQFFENKLETKPIENEKIFKTLMDGSFINNVSNHRMVEYWKIIENILSNEENERPRKIQRITDLDLSVDKLEKEVKIFEKERVHELFLYINGKNKEQLLFVKIENERGLDLPFISESNDISKGKEGKFEDRLIYKFNILDCFYRNYFKNSKIKEKKIKCTLIGHFNTIEFDLLITDKNLRNSFTDKEIAIQEMPMDSLYLTAAFYIQIIGKLDFSNTNHKLIENKNELLIIFEKIDRDWNEILRSSWEKFPLDNDKKKQLKGALFSSLNLKDINTFESIINEEINFNQNLSSLKEAVTREPNALKVIQKLYPTLYELKKQYCLQVIKQNWHKNILRFNLVFIDFKNIKDILSYYFFSKQIDDDYRTFLFHIIKSQNLDFDSNEQPYLGTIEKFISDRMKDRITELDAAFLKLIDVIIQNRRIRDILCENYFVGVIGTKKCGKSTFTNLITGMDSNASMTITTESAKPFNLYNKDNLFLIDYPHFDSSDISYQLEFFFSRAFLNRIFVVFEAKSKGETEGNKKIMKIIREYYNNKYTVLFNFSDMLINDDTIDIAKFKEEICKNLGINDNQEKENVILACLDPNLDSLKADRIKLTKVIKNRQEIEKLFYDLVMTKDNEIIVDKTLNEKFASIQIGHDFKKIEIHDKEGSRKVYTLKQNKSNTEMDNECINSFEKLITKIRKNFDIDNPKIVSQADQSIKIEKFEDFFNSELTVFMLE
ncbi:unnamed protein product [Brachionus calyciflorus]|uniref:Fungal lipase-like domain-containing protein n=1 Tax=Brachionus calyciflorus TaxID=104777 RepID=A0A814I5I1_9BILA|nr:unnamed protein product [Brachionus calyciflorus]